MTGTQLFRRAAALLVLCAALIAPPALAEAFSLQVKRATSYVYINEKEMSVTLTMSGGTAPYTAEVSFAVGGETKETFTRTLLSPGSVSVSRMPRKGGEWTIAVRATDAAGAEIRKSVRIKGSEHPEGTEEAYQAALDRLELTGDWRADLIAVAQLQLGQRESDSDFIEGDKGQKQGATRYGVWMEDPYSEWCASFLAYSMWKAQIPLYYELAYADVQDVLSRVIAMGAFRRQDYEPQMGDLVFIIPKNEDFIAHIGLVEFAADTSIGTIEGNVSSSVARRGYYKQDARIAGYASMQALMEYKRAPIREEVPVVYQVRDLPDCRGTVNHNRVNLRSGPERTDDRLLGDLRNGTKVRVLAEITMADDRWYQVECEGKIGCILARYVDAELPEESGCGCDDNCGEDCACLCHGFSFTVEEDTDF